MRRWGRRRRETQRDQLKQDFDMQEIRKKAKAKGKKREKEAADDFEVRAEAGVERRWMWKIRGLIVWRARSTRLM